MHTHVTTLQWTPEITHHCRKVPFILVGTKIEKRNDEDILKKLSQRKKEPITFEMGKKLAEERGAVKYMECSYVTHEGLVDVFEAVIQTFLLPKVSYEPSSNSILHTCICATCIC